MFWLLLSLGFLLILFLVTLLIFCSHSGLFHDVDVSTGKPPVGSISDADQHHIIAYKFSRGKYRDAGHLFTELCSLLTRPSITLGLYFDNPEKVAERDCRYAVGVILGVGSSVDSLSEEQRAVLAELEKHDYHPFILPPITCCLHSWFPFTSTFSVILAVNRVYPALRAEIREKRLEAGPAIEVYASDRIYFLMPLENQTAFFVPECGPCENTPEGSTDTPPQLAEQPVAPPVPLDTGDANSNESNNNNNNSEQVAKILPEPESTAESALLTGASCSTATTTQQTTAIEASSASSATSATARAAGADGDESDGSGSHVGDETTETETTDADSSNATASSFEQVDRDDDSSARASPTHSPPPEAAREGD